MKVESVTEAAVLAALSKVQEPELMNDLVSLHMIKDLEVNAVSGKVLHRVNHSRLSVENHDRKRSPGSGDAGARGK